MSTSPAGRSQETRPRSSRRPSRRRPARLLRPPRSSVSARARRRRPRVEISLHHLTSHRIADRGRSTSGAWCSSPWCSTSASSSRPTSSRTSRGYSSTCRRRGTRGRQGEPEPSVASRQTEDAAGGSPAAAVVWEEVGAQTSESAVLSASFLAFIAIEALRGCPRSSRVARTRRDRRLAQPCVG